MKSFADLPSELARRVSGGERVVCVLLDAFGMRFLERYGDHPVLRRLEVVPLDSQFPSTTTAHVTTMNTGLPVEQHGLYEWSVYEPSVDDVITPLRFEGPELSGMLPASFYESLPVASAVFQPARFSPSAYDRAALRGAAIRPYDDFGEALRDAGRAREGYAYVYLDAIDATGHVCGPSSPEFDDTVTYALRELEAALPSLSGSTLVVTADHGQVDVDPARTLWLDELWPALGEQLLYPAAGSARDVFLHVREPEAVAEALQAVCGDAAQVFAGDAVLDLFARPAGERLRARVGNVCVLPEAGRMAWLRSAPAFQTGFKGHHGGRSADEARTWAGFVAL